jgi:hypothetical protein
MVLVLKPNYRVVVVDGVTHCLAEPPTLGTVELLRDVLGWEARYSYHDGNVTLYSPCAGGCETVAGGEVTVRECQCR